MLLCAVLVDCLGAPIAGPTMPSAYVHSTLKACCAPQAESFNDMCTPALARLHLTVFALQYPMFLYPTAFYPKIGDISQL